MQYLRVKDMCPDKPESLYEIGYMCIGKSSIYVISFINLLNSFGCLCLYFIVFSGIAAKLLVNYSDYAIDEIWYTSRTVYVLGLGVLLIPVVLKKELAELEILSVILFASIGIFILSVFILLVFQPGVVKPEVDSQFWLPTFGPSLVSGISVCCVAYSY